MEYNKPLRDQYGKRVRDEIHDHCPNPNCNLKRTNHTTLQAQNCTRAASN